jgi:prepilin-type N-terminal cleavage/methylation domain-containing protein
LNTNSRGVTLVELVIVIVIVAIGATLMLPNIGAWVPHYRLRIATRDVVSVLRVAQIRAAAGNVPYRVLFNDSVEPPRYTLQRETAGGVVNEGPSQALPTGISIGGLSFSGYKYVTFGPNSTALGGNIVLQNARGARNLIRVSGTTGRVRIVQGGE